VLRRLRRCRGAALATLFLLVLLTFWIFGGWILPERFAGVTREEHSHFGDRFGAIGALFSAGALWGVIIALYLQWNALTEQRKELEDQALRLDKQTFETKFFQLLTIHNDIVNGIDLRARGDAAVVATGRDCFRNFYERKLAQEYSNALAAGGPAADIINRAYMTFFHYNQGDVGHYFRHLYHTLEFVKTSEITDKRFYTNLLRAQLSTYEVGVVFYHCLSEAGRQLKPLVEQFALLEYLSINELFDPGHPALYASSAYASQ
jgi:hypothetical protein